MFIGHNTSPYFTNMIFTNTVLPKPHRSVTGMQQYYSSLSRCQPKNKSKKKGAGLKKPTPFPISMHRARLIIRFYLFFRNIAVFKTFDFFNTVKPVGRFGVIGKGTDPYAVR